jgi:ABC-type dipeptide/oligopeptide/nickel transport system permease subunit
VIKKLLYNPLFIIGSVIAVGFMLIILFSPVLTPHNPLETDILNTLAPPSDKYPFGTDDLGRCILSRFIAGCRTTLGSALIVETAILLLGIIIGSIAGYFGGIADSITVIAIDILLAFPSIILALVIASLLGAGLKNLMIAMILVYWVEPARIARSMAQTLREKEFIIASRAVGSGGFKIMLIHILPHILPNMLIFGTLNIASIIIGISSLSFIGFGVKPPYPEWGSILTEARAYMQINPLMLILTIAGIILSTACFQCIGEALRDALNPRISHLRIRKTIRKGTKLCS